MDLDDPEDQRRASGRRGALTRRVIVPLATIVTLTLGALLLATGPRDPMPFEDPTGRPREALAAREFIVVAGTPWAAKACWVQMPTGSSRVVTGTPSTFGQLLFRLTLMVAGSSVPRSSCTVWSGWSSTTVRSTWR